MPSLTVIGAPESNFPVAIVDAKSNLADKPTVVRTRSHDASSEPDDPTLNETNAFMVIKFPNLLPVRGFYLKSIRYLSAYLESSFSYSPGVVFMSVD